MPEVVGGANNTPELIMPILLFWLLFLGTARQAGAQLMMMTCHTGVAPEFGRFWNPIKKEILPRNRLDFIGFLVYFWGVLPS